MACDISKGRLEPCKDSVGGIKALYFINWSSKAYATLDGSTDEVTNLSSVFGTPTTVTVYKWEVKGATGVEETITSSRDTGSTFYEQVLTAAFKKMDAATRKELKLLAWGRPQVIVHDNNGNALIYGLLNGMEVTGGTIPTGQAMGDLSGYTLTMSGQEKNPAYLLKGSTADNPFAGLTTAPTLVVGT